MTPRHLFHYHSFFLKKFVLTKDAAMAVLAVRSPRALHMLCLMANADVFFDLVNDVFFFNWRIPFNHLLIPL